jgi:hypothetical protein
LENADDAVIQNASIFMVSSLLNRPREATIDFSASIDIFSVNAARYFPILAQGDAMNHIVRRATKAPVVTATGHELPTRTFKNGGISVTSQLSVGIEPRLFFAWSVVPRYWTQGYTLLVFRSMTGFCTEKYPADLNLHGQLIIETNQDARHEECPTEGTHYFTLVLHKKIWLGMREKMSVVRFSEIVPSAKVALGRIKDQVDLQELVGRHQVGTIEYEAKLHEAEVRRIQARRKLGEAMNPPRKTTGAESLIAEELENIDAMFQASFAVKKKMIELKKDPRFLSLGRKERQAILEKLQERLDAAEIAARHEMKGT